jgi:hypothetical protein
MAQVEIPDTQIPRLTRLSEEYHLGFVQLINLIISIGIEMLEDPENISQEELQKLFPEEDG